MADGLARGKSVECQKNTKTKQESKIDLYVLTVRPKKRQFCNM